MSGMGDTVLSLTLRGMLLGFPHEVGLGLRSIFYQVQEVFIDHILRFLKINNFIGFCQMPFGFWALVENNIGFWCLFVFLEVKYNPINPGAKSADGVLR